MMKTLSILVVEDEDDQAELISYAIEKADGIEQVHRAKDGEEAFSWMRDRALDPNSVLPNIVLMDLKMPRVGGLELLKKIKSDEALKQTPVVVLTTSNSSRDIDEAYACFASGYLIKPLGFEQLRTMIKDFAHYWGKYNQFAVSN